jgi:hypothetical protein
MEQTTAIEQATSVERIPCAICGLIANVDPSFHTERYGHIPVINIDGQLVRFDFQTYTFRQKDVAWRCPFCGGTDRRKCDPCISDPAWQGPK